MNVELTLMNRSLAGEDTTIVFFQRNRFAGNPDHSQIVAWQVCSLPAGTSRKIHISQHLSVSATDASGNQCQQHLTEYGQSWHVAPSKNRDWMVLGLEPVAADRMTVRNMQPETITAQIYKDGRLLAAEPVSAKQTATFGFEAAVWFGITSVPVTEGEYLPEALGIDFGTELKLGGHSKAQLILDGQRTHLDFPPVPQAQVIRV
jgi:hypothetical protein